MALVLPESLEIHYLVLLIIHLYHISPLSGSLIFSLGLLLGKPPIALIYHNGLALAVGLHPGIPLLFSGHYHIPAG